MSHRHNGSEVQAGAAPRNGRSVRYAPETIERAVALVLSGVKREKILREIGCTGESLRLWLKKAKEKLAGSASPDAATDDADDDAAREAIEESAVRPTTTTPSRLATSAAATPSDEDVLVMPASPTPTTAPKDPGSGLSEFEVEAILELKRERPTMGPAQIRAQLKRFKGWRLSLRAIARALREHGYELEHRGGRPQEEQPPTRWEAPHRNALWQVDFTEVRISEGRRALGVIIDDFSRFVVGYILLEAPTSEAVVAMFKDSIRRHGKPEAVYTDRAGPFMAWGKADSFQRFLQDELIEHHVTPAYRPRGRGKIEALLKTVQRELWEVEHFASEVEARTALEKFFAAYNHRRAHMGLDGLCPADRFFGRWEAVLAAVQAESRKRQGADVLAEKVRLTEEPSAAERAEILRLVAVDGELQMRFFGHRVCLGAIRG
ncbi:MAG TPA: DDE-type integrase/transposase/recombinase [Planctomycetota bacterium]|nr:DDE-type integrase/transposase/recombinase [Planctomycetota bacterium]